MAELTPELKHFGPCRVIGMSCTDQRYSEIFGAFLPRRGEIESPTDAALFGISRCLPDAGQEYTAATAATPGSAVPEGMIELSAADATYAVWTLNGIAQIGPGWSAVHEWLRTNGEWESYCVRDENGVCGCQNHPCFEMYPADHEQTNLVYIYLPVRRKG